MDKIKIQYCSDLHIEISDNRDYLQNHIALKPVGDILIIAGDFYVFKKGIKDLTWFIDKYCKLYKVVYWLPGNHEYYGFSATQADKLANKQIAENVFQVNNISILYKDVNLIFSTLWSHIMPENELYCKAYVNDFQEIEYFQNESLRPYDFNQLHKKSLDFISGELDRSPVTKNVVITHHVPTMKNYPEGYKTSKINNAFVVELEPFISSKNIKAWIYGHSHFNVPDFKINKTKMLTNQLGYVSQEEHLTFNDSAFLEL